MDNYVTGAAIKSLREAKRLTQEELAERIHVSAKAVSKWETGKGFPDISLLEPLAKALDVSVIELLSGEDIRNRNRAFNMLKSVFYVCPACGNVIRVKGFVRTGEDTRVQINATRGGLEIEPTIFANEVLIVTGEKLDRSRIDAIWAPDSEIITPGTETAH